MKFLIRFLAVASVVLVLASTATAFFGRHRSVVRESYREGTPLRAAIFPRLAGGCSGSYAVSSRTVQRGAGCVGTYSLPTPSASSGCYGSSRSLVYPPAPLTVPTPKVAVPPLPKEIKPEVKKPIEPEPQPQAAAVPDALDEVNYKRALRGLRPFLRDPLLTVAARNTAVYRARYRMFGHTSNDFAFLPPGASADAAGCAAYTSDYGFLACCVYDDYQYAGAWSEMGPDGRVYHHLFVSYRPSADSGVITPQASPPPTVNAPVYSYAPQNCVNGQCEVPQVRRLGLFRRR